MVVSVVVFAVMWLVVMPMVNGCRIGMFPGRCMEYRWEMSNG
jgi:hypothetical protein